MAFKKLIGHFLCGRGLPRTGSPGHGAPGAPLQQFPGRPLPLRGKGLHRTRERAGERGGSPAPAAARRGGGGARGGVGAAPGGGRPEPPPPPRDFPAGPERRERWRSSADLPCHPWLAAADLSLLLKGSLLVHASRVGSSPCSLPPGS